MESVFNGIKHSVKNWWTSLILGIVYVIVALSNRKGISSWGWYIIGLFRIMLSFELKNLHKRK